jgi:hypothetical protein
MSSPLEPRKSVNRLLVEKMGARNVDEFRGNAGEIFYDPAEPGLFLSNGPNEDPSDIVGGAIADLVIDAIDYVVPQDLSRLNSLPTSRFN